MRSLILFASLILFFSLGSPVLAQYNKGCPSIYGAGCPTGNLFINKTVKNPQTGEFVDTLSSNGPNFLPGQEVNFKIEVKNTGSSDLNNITVTDKLPDFVSFVSGVGTFDKNTKTLTWSIDKLRSNESRFFDLKVKVVDSKDIPDMGITCLTNFSQAQKEQMVAQDTAVFCVQTRVLGTTPELPKTGPKETTVVLLSSLSILFLAFAMKKQIKTLKGGE